MTIERIPELTRIPEEVEIPPHIAETGIQAVEREFKTQVHDSRGQQLLINPATQQITIQLPYDKTTLSGWLKGSVSDSLTWFAAFWLRMIKKAVYFGWRVGGKEGGNVNSNG